MPAARYDLSAQEISALRFIANAQSPPIKYANRYRIKEDMHMAHGTVAEMVARWKRRGLIHVVDKAPSRVSRDVPVEGYDLTPDGLAWALLMTNPKGMRLEWSLVASKYERFLPLIFGKWPYFVAQGLGGQGEAAATMLSLAAHRYVHRGEEDEAQIRLAFQMPGSPIRTRTGSPIRGIGPLVILETYFLLYLEPYSPIVRAPEAALISKKDRGRLLAAIGKDPDLGDRSKQAIRYLVAYHGTFPEDWSDRILEKMFPEETARR